MSDIVVSVWALWRGGKGSRRRVDPAARLARHPQLTHLTHTIAHRVGRFLERQGLLERDAENSYLAGDVVEGGPLDQLFGHSITYRISVGPHAGRKVFTLQTLPECNEPFDDQVGKVAGFSLHAGVAARAHERKKLERLCRYIARLSPGHPLLLLFRES